MDSSAWAAYEIIAIVTIGATLAGLLVGFAWGCRATNQKELVSEEEIMQIFPASDPLEWDHLPVHVEREQAL